MFKFKITEYQSTHPDLRQFRDMAAKTLGETSIKPLKKIVSVGTPFDKKGFIDLPGAGEAWHIKECFARLAHLRIPVSPDFVFVPVDLRYGQDFLNPTQNLKTDILFFSLIAGPTHPERNLWDRIKEGDIPPYFSGRPPYVFFKAPHFNTSPFDKGTESWAAATERTEAKVVISYGESNKDIDVRKFNCPSYIDASYEHPSCKGMGLTHYGCTRQALLRKDVAIHLQK